MKQDINSWAAKYESLTNSDETIAAMAKYYTCSFMFDMEECKVIIEMHDGKVKSIAYESGMNPIGTARKRFNVRFYLIAMVFLVFDVEVIFLYPWAVTFPNVDRLAPGASEWLIRILFFLFTTVVAYLYGYRKGVFKFD